MTSKKIIIEFADPRLRAVDHCDDLRDAYTEAVSRWRARHRIFVNPPYTMRGRVFMTIEAPDEVVESGNLTRHLGEMSKILLRDDYYKQFKVGNRLLYYYDSDNILVDGHM